MRALSGIRCFVSIVSRLAAREQRQIRSIGGESLPGGLLEKQAANAVLERLYMQASELRIGLPFEKLLQMEDRFDGTPSPLLRQCRDNGLLKNLLGALHPLKGVGSVKAIARF